MQRVKTERVISLSERTLAMLLSPKYLMSMKAFVQ